MRKTKKYDRNCRNCQQPIYYGGVHWWHKHNESSFCVKSGIDARIAEPEPDEAERVRLAGPELLDALKFAKQEWQHNFPSDCYSNGPHSGDLVQDYVVCPGCAVQAKIDAAISKAEGRA